MYSMPDDKSRLVIARPDLLGWGTVRAGLALTFLGGLLKILSIVLAVVVALTTEQKNLQGAPALLVMVLMLCSLGVVTGIILALAGVCMSSAAPSASGAKGWGIGATLFVLLSVVLSVVLAIAQVDAVERAVREAAAQQQLILGGPAPTPAPDAKPGFSADEVKILCYAGQGLFFVELACYLLFLRGVARYFGRRGLAAFVAFYLIVWVLYLAGLNVLAHFPEVAQGIDPQTLRWGELGGIAVLIVWGFMVIALVRGAVTAGLLRS